MVVLRAGAAALLALLVGHSAVGAEEKAVAPEIVIQLTPETDGVQPGKDLILYLSITNRSAIALDNVRIASGSKAFAVDLPSLPPTLLPFATVSGEAKVSAAAQSPVYGKHQLPIVLTYNWTIGRNTLASTQTGMATIEVRRWLDDEAKGLPGGTPALFALLFPIIPAFLAFQLVDRLRQRKGLHLPTFDSAYVVPAFFVALLVNSLPLFPTVHTVDLTPQEIVLFSLLLGATWPVLRWIWELLLRRVWCFRESDSPGVYLRKVLFSPWSPRPPLWISGKASEHAESWSGLLLYQPGGEVVLGSTIKISRTSAPATPKEVVAQEAFVAEVDKSCSLILRYRLWIQVIRGRLVATPLVYPTQGDEAQARPTHRLVVSGEEIEGLKRLKSERREWLHYSQ